jgi:hypothetical protein
MGVVTGPAIVRVCGAPTALKIAFACFPSPFTGWANLCRTYGALNAGAILGDRQNFAPRLTAQKAAARPPQSKKRDSLARIVALANGVLPVATCFTAAEVRVSVFFRTAIHAPGGWALIENLPNVFTGDRIVVGLWSTEIPSPEDKALVSLCAEECVSRLAQRCPEDAGDKAARLRGDEGSVARREVACQPELSRAMRDKRGHLA